MKYMNKSILYYSVTAFLHFARKIARFWSYFVIFNKFKETSNKRVVNYVSPSDRGGDMLLYLCPLSSLSFLSVQRFLSCRHATLTQHWPTVYDTDPTLAQYWVSCLAPL